MEQIAAARLTAADVALREQASLVLYLVSPDYALRSGPTYEFALDREAIEAQGCEVHFSSAVQLGERTYRTVGTSRAVALTTTAASLEQARGRLASARPPCRCWSGAATWATSATWTLSRGSSLPAPMPRRRPAPARRGLSVSCKDGAMIVERSMHPQFLSNTYLVADGDGGPAFFVDAGGPVKPLIDGRRAPRAEADPRAADPSSLRPRQRARLLRGRWPGLQVLINPLERELVEAGVERRRRLAELPSMGSIEAGQTLSFGALEVRPLHTPGHTAGMLSFLVGEPRPLAGRRPSARPRPRAPRPAGFTGGGRRRVHRRHAVPQLGRRRARPGTRRTPICRTRSWAR